MNTLYDDILDSARTAGESGRGMSYVALAVGALFLLAIFKGTR